ncbi:hypothetical protein JTE90_013339 [Oedothorax gibbosus]|uniref:Uncharacterized protein n=1 Tax=Oedothorax gibbosus TaxID=931172 RepID=A0AAV6VF05_9ARAC|nr:hypothetical protein JTE90_013339 [Oedothorax gibbosus]
MSFEHCACKTNSIDTRRATISFNCFAKLITNSRFANNISNFRPLGFVFRIKILQVPYCWRVSCSGADTELETRLGVLVRLGGRIHGAPEPNFTYAKRNQNPSHKTPGFRPLILAIAKGGFQR